MESVKFFKSNHPVAFSLFSDDKVVCHFVDLVQQFPALYDTSSNLYMNKKERELAWTTVGGELRVWILSSGLFPRMPEDLVFANDLLQNRWSYFKRRSSDYNRSQTGQSSKKFKHSEILEKIASMTQTAVNIQPRESALVQTAVNHVEHDSSVDINSYEIDLRNPTDSTHAILEPIDIEVDEEHHRCSTPISSCSITPNPSDDSNQDSIQCIESRFSRRKKRGEKRAPIDDEDFYEEIKRIRTYTFESLKTIACN